jgi:hypothetical protein
MQARWPKIERQHAEAAALYELVAAAGMPVGGMEAAALSTLPADWAALRAAIGAAAAGREQEVLACQLELDAGVRPARMRRTGGLLWDGHAADHAPFSAQATRRPARRSAASWRPQRTARCCTRRRTLPAASRAWAAWPTASQPARLTPSAPRRTGGRSAWPPSPTTPCRAAHLRRALVGCACCCHPCSPPRSDAGLAGAGDPPAAAVAERGRLGSRGGGVGRRAHPQPGRAGHGGLRGALRGAAGGAGGRPAAQPGARPHLALQSLRTPPLP